MANMTIGASFVATRYRVRTQTGDHYVRCGADLLLNGMRSDVRAEGRCPVCETLVQFQVRDRHLLGLKPDTSRLHVVEVPMANGQTGIECEGSPIFDKEDCLHAWLDGYRGKPGSIVKPQDFLDRMIRLRIFKGSN